MYLCIVLLFASTQLMWCTGAKTGGCANYGATYEEICSDNGGCKLTCGGEIEIFSAAFKVFYGGKARHHTCGPINITVWKEWCNIHDGGNNYNDTCYIGTSWVGSFQSPGPNFQGTQFLLLSWSCKDDDSNSTEYSAPDPGSFITGYENFTDYQTTQTALSINNSRTTGTGDTDRHATATDASSKPTATQTLTGAHDSQNQNTEDDSLGQGSLADEGFGGGETAGIVIGTLVCVGALALLVVLLLLRQRRLSKRLNELENPVYKDPGLMSTPVIAGTYDNEAYGQVTDIKSNGKSPSDMVYDNSVTSNNPITIYDNNVQAKPAHVPYLEIVGHSNTYDQVILQPDGPTYSIPDKDKVVPNAPPEDDSPEVPADYELAQPPVPPKSFTIEDTLDNKVTGEDELVDNEAYRAFDGEGGDGLVYNDAYHAFADKQGAKDN